MDNIVYTVMQITSLYGLCVGGHPAY